MGRPRRQQRDGQRQQHMEEQQQEHSQQIEADVTYYVDQSRQEEHVFTTLPFLEECSVALPSPPASTS